MDGVLDGGIIDDGIAFWIFSRYQMAIRVSLGIWKKLEEIK